MYARGVEGHVVCVIDSGSDALCVVSISAGGCA
jgi:hypothetical protein